MNASKRNAVGADGRLQRPECEIRIGSGYCSPTRPRLWDFRRIVDQRSLLQPAVVEKGAASRLLVRDKQSALVVAEMSVAAGHEFIVLDDQVVFRIRADAKKLFVDREVFASRGTRDSDQYRRGPTPTPGARKIAGPPASCAALVE
ncbi:MAG: hypothetical protein ACREX4_17115 [Gammaproteobacteria bacterium]